MTSNIVSLIKETARERNLNADIFGFCDLLNESKKRRKKKKSAYHSYVTKDGHHIDIHIHNNKDGSGSATHYNKHLNAVVKKTIWSHPSAHPTIKELMESYVEERKNFLIESFFLLEREGKIDGDTGGKISEHSAVMHVHLHILENLPKNSKEREHHTDRVEYHRKSIEKLMSGKNTHDGTVRIHHGKMMARLAIDHALEKGRKKFKKEVQIVNVGHTAKSGDIGRFTRGKHNDGQENPSDMVIEVKPVSKKKKLYEATASPEDESHFEGFSLKSAKKAKRITAKNPAIDFGGILDHNTRKLNTEKISRSALKSVREKTLGSWYKKGTNEKVIRKHSFLRDRTAADMGRFIKRLRVKEKVEDKEPTSIEKIANKHAYDSKIKIAEELHNHLHHLINNTNDGHHQIRRMLTDHLTAQTSLPWSKIHARGEKIDKVSATIEPGNESDIAKIIQHPDTKFHTEHRGARVTVSAIDGEGKFIPLAHYSPKTNSNALKCDAHGWNVLPAAKS